MISSTGSRSAFARHLATLRLRVGDAAVDVRHEAFFLQANHRRWAGLRGVAALLRDAWQLLRSPMPVSCREGDEIILLVTLAGKSGWGTVARCLQHVQPGNALALVHPRLSPRDLSPGLPVLRPARPSLPGVGRALATFARVLLGQRSLLLASCLSRRVLWRDSLARTLAGRRGPLVLHNDFDMMSNAAIGQGVTTVCLQHGVPTDEFFPTRADWYVVWGAGSRRAFVEGGSPVSHLVEDALGRAPELRAPEQPPAGLSLLSQAHAPILGRELPGWLRATATALLQAEPGLRILLHPQESQPYPGVAALACSRPPHAEFDAGATPRLVLGCCSTALFDAALAGHWVVRLVAPVEGNRSALQTLEGLPCAENVVQVLEMYQRLRTDVAFREETARAQLAWLQESFTAETGGLARLLAGLGRAVDEEQA